MWLPTKKLKWCPKHGTVNGICGSSIVVQERMTMWICWSCRVVSLTVSDMRLKIPLEMMLQFESGTGLYFAVYIIMKVNLRCAGHWKGSHCMRAADTRSSDDLIRWIAVVCSRFRLTLSALVPESGTSGTDTSSSSRTTVPQVIHSRVASYHHPLSGVPRQEGLLVQC